jgi:hypothetical protein
MHPNMWRPRVQKGPPFVVVEVVTLGTVEGWRPSTMVALRYRSPGHLGHVDRATALIEDICREKIRGCSYREGQHVCVRRVLINRDCGASYPPMPRCDQAPQRSEMAWHTGPCCCMYADSGILFNQKRLRVDLVHEDEWNSMRSFAFYGTGNPCAPVSPSARLPSIFTSTYGGCDHATGQASFEAETHNQSRRREGAGRRTGSFAGGQCIRIHDAHCRYPAI